MGETKPEVKPQASVDTFTKQQLAESKRYKKKRDLLEALLEDGKTYTIAQVDKITGDYLKKEVK